MLLALLTPANAFPILLPNAIPDESILPAFPASLPPIPGPGLLIGYLYLSNPVGILTLPGIPT